MPDQDVPGDGADHEDLDADRVRCPHELGQTGRLGGVGAVVDELLPTAQRAKELRVGSADGARGTPSRTSSRLGRDESTELG